MSDSLLDMTVFTRVIDVGSLSAASREMNMSLAVVSKRLARLEKRLGVRLVNRTTRHLALTDEGREFYNRTIGILADVADAEDTVRSRKNRASGLLRVTATAAFARRQLSRLVPLFLEHYPDVRIDLEVSDAVLDLVQAGCDVGIRFGSLRDSSLIARRLAPNHRIVCGSPAYFAKWGKPEHPRDLKDHRCIAFGSPPKLDWQLVEGGETTVVRVIGTLTTSSGDVAHEWALEGAGLVLKSIWDVGPDMDAGRLERALPRCFVQAADIHAIYPHRAGVAAKVNAFVDFLSESLQRQAREPAHRKIQSVSRREANQSP
jgi:DNA-binding transcriptional LysR family regulator